MASVGFRWLDILEKEFDKAFVDLDLTVGELESEEPDLVYNVRQKLCTLSSCFAQLTHKAQTIFQNSAKIEAELIHMRAELVESKSKREVLEQELHNLLLQLHTSQLTNLPANRIQNTPDVDNIKKKIEEAIQKSPQRNRSTKNDEVKLNTNLLDYAQLRIENSQLQIENTTLRNSILALNSEVYGAKLAAKYLDKELAGRIQQLQLLGREMRGEIRDKLWRQLESEILLQRHKTVVRACRRNGNSDTACAKPDLSVLPEDNTQHFGDVRTVIVKRKPGQGLGISITGGREHGVPILISELEPNGPAALSGQLYIGDAILVVNDKDLRQVCHREAVDILQQQTGDCRLQVQYIAADDSDNSLEEEGLHFRIFDSEVCELNDCITLHPLHSSGVMNTPTAPRTPESDSDSRTHSRNYNLKVHKPVDVSNRDSELIYCKDNRDSHILCEINSNEIPTTTTTENLSLTDNYPVKLAKMTESNTDLQSKIEENLHCSSNSLVSDNLSSPMQTSTDIFLDSEILSTDAASNESHSPKTSQIFKRRQQSDLLEIKRFNEFCLSAEHLESCDSSPVHYHEKTKKPFGVKTLQSIFTGHDGYSDISSTTSEHESNRNEEERRAFDGNLNSFLSETFSKDFSPNNGISISGGLGSKKYFKLNGQNLRIGKALRLCPNEEFNEQVDAEHKKEKLLARYVYNANMLSVDGIGDPDFGTPV